MEELIAQVASIVRGMWRFRWTGLVVAWVVVNGFLKKELPSSRIRSTPPSEREAYRTGRLPP